MNNKDQVKNKSKWFISNRNNYNYDQKLPDEFIPNSVEEGYAIQRLLINSMNDVVAWKLGGTSKTTRKIFNTSGVYYGPIFKGHLFKSGSEIPISLLGSPKGEAEISFRLSDNISKITKYKEDPWMLVDAIAPSVELPASVVEDLPKYGLPTLVADGCSYGALVIGAKQTVSKNLINSINSLSINIYNSESQLCQGDTKNIITTPIGALYEFVKLALKNNINLKPGQWVATGGCTPCILLPIKKKITANFGLLGSISLRINNK
jgi:2-keto-4-pentenoate hydratase